MTANSVSIGRGYRTIILEGATGPAMPHFFRRAPPHTHYFSSYTTSFSFALGRTVSQNWNLYFPDLRPPCSSLFNVSVQVLINCPHLPPYTCTTLSNYKAMWDAALQRGSQYPRPFSSSKQLEKVLAPAISDPRRGSNAV